MADAGGDMAAGMEMADMAGGGAAGMDMMAAMTPAMSMSFLLPGIGLGLLKGMLFGKKSSVKTTFHSTYHYFSRAVQRQAEELQPQLRLPAASAWIRVSPARIWTATAAAVPAQSLCQQHCQAKMII